MMSVKSSISMLICIQTVIYVLPGAVIWPHSHECINKQKNKTVNVCSSWFSFVRKWSLFSGVSSLNECVWSKKHYSLMYDSDEMLPHACLSQFLSVRTARRVTFTAGCSQFLRFCLFLLFVKRLSERDNELHQTQVKERKCESAHLISSPYLQSCWSNAGKPINSKPVLFLLISTRQLNRPNLSSA